jgi:hypothetical protein
VPPTQGVVLFLDAPHLDNDKVTVGSTFLRAPETGPESSAQADIGPVFDGTFPLLSHCPGIFEHLTNGSVFISGGRGGGDGVAPALPALLEWFLRRQQHAQQRRRSSC